MSVSLYYLTPETALPVTREGEMLRVALALNAGKSVGQLVDILFETMDGLVPFDRLGVAMLEPGDILHLRHVRSKAPVLWGPGARAPLQGSSLEPIVREQQIRIINDLAAYLREHPDSKTSPYLVKEGMRSSLTFPLIAQQRPVGVVFFSSTRTDAYGPQDVNYLRTLASGLGTAFERGQYREELEQAHAQLKSLDDLKRNFLGNLSHELRTPLSIVTCYADALEDEISGELTPVQHEYLGQVLTAAGRLRSLLNDLFDFTELESGALRLNLTEIDLGAIAREVADETRPSLVNAGLQFSVEVPDQPIVLQGDPPRLARVIRALLDNAYKFTAPPGHVSLRAGGDPRSAWLEIQDTGIGIVPEHQQKVFDTFFQVDSGATRRYGGAGLGLPLARLIVEAHGGQLSLTSRPGSGSTFRVVLPRSAPAPAKESAGGRG